MLNVRPVNFTGTLQFTDTLGRVVIEREVAQGQREVQLNVGNLLAGTYYLNAGEVSKKIRVQ